MRLHAVAPPARKALEDLDEFRLGHRARGKEDGVALEAVDERGGARERGEERGEVAEEEVPEEDAEVALDEQRVVRREQRGRVGRGRGRRALAAWAERLGEEEGVLGARGDVRRLAAAAPC